MNSPGYKCRGNLPYLTVPSDFGAFSKSGPDIKYPIRTHDRVNKFGTPKCSRLEDSKPAAGNSQPNDSLLGLLLALSSKKCFAEADQNHNQNMNMDVGRVSWGAVLRDILSRARVPHASRSPPCRCSWVPCARILMGKPKPRRYHPLLRVCSRGETV